MITRIITATLTAVLGIFGSTTLSSSLPTPASDNTSSPFTVGLHIPWALPQERIMQNNQQITWQGEWPNYQVPTIRLWDTHTTWADLQPKAQQYNWQTLDNYILKASNSGTNDILFVISGTPEWAATTPAPNSAPWIGNNSASPPNPQAWEQFITDLVTRYKGKITSYEIWNEPNVLYFWQGTPDQLAALVQTATQIIHEKDPTANIISPAPVLASTHDIKTVLPYWQALKERNWAGIDIIGTHVYPDRPYTTQHFTRITNTIALTLKKLGWTKEKWITETSYLTDKLIPNNKAYKLVKDTNISARRHFPRIYWYAWTTADNGFQPTLLFQPKTGAAKALSES